MSKRILAACFCVLACVLGAATRPAYGLSNIRSEVWSYQNDVPLAPGETVVDVSFFATVGDMDHATRVMFSVVAVDDAQQEHLLLRYIWGDWDWIPAYGTRGQVFVSIALWCDDEGRVRARPLDMQFVFCSFAQAAQQEGEIELFEAFAVEPTGSFGLTLVDRGGRAGVHPTPGVFSCVDDTSPGWSAAAALEQLKHRSHARTHETPEFEPAGSIGIYFDAAGTQCAGRLEPNELGRVYVVAKLGGMIECGIAGSEFRFVGIPEDWIVHAIPNPDFVSIGNPLAEGAALGFSCAQPRSGNVILYTVDIFPTEAVEDLEFDIVPRDPPSSPEAQCAHFVLCDKPMYTKFCVQGRSCLVNASKESPVCDTETAVAPVTWGFVKSVFR